MRVSVFFYKSLDPASVVWRQLDKLARAYPHRYRRIGLRAGFAVENLTWKEAYSLAAAITEAVVKADCASVVDEMRVQVQNDVEESPLLYEVSDKIDTPPPP